MFNTNYADEHNFPSKAEMKWNKSQSLCRAFKSDKACDQWLNWLNSREVWPCAGAFSGLILIGQIGACCGIFHSPPSFYSRAGAHIGKVFQRKTCLLCLISILFSSLNKHMPSILPTSGWSWSCVKGKGWNNKVLETVLATTGDKWL